MCGIIGEIKKRSSINLEHFNELRDLLFHRGPDGYGTEILGEGNIAFGHRRLSIIDLSENGRQPMSNEDGSVWITFNGEIYNFCDLKDELSNHQFKSNSDTEVLIHGYEEWGIEKLLSKIKGMFAFGLWDEREKKLFIARDRFGIKPLVYQQTTDHFLFASELKCIANHENFEKRINQYALADYFTYSYVPQPLTIWEGVYKLPPAHYGVFDVNTSTLNIQKYWGLNIENDLISDKEAIDKVHKLIDKSIEQHLISDVPVGLFLSGGYDSTTLLMKMLEMGYKPDVFTVGFPGHLNDETEQAKAIANYFGVKHFIEEIPYGLNVFEMLSDLSSIYDEPFAGSSMITNHLVAKATVRNTKVAFSGEGADEVFGGYKWYKKIEEYYQQRNLKRYLKSIRNGNFNAKDEFLNLYNNSMLGVSNENKSLNILNRDISKNIKQRGLWFFSDNYERSSQLQNRIKQAQFIDSHTFVSNHCLYRADLSSMVNSLELRVPFLDHEIYEYVFSLNPSVYLKAGVKKFLLEEKLRKRVPNAVIDMPKRGFSFHFGGDNFQEEFNRISRTGKIVEFGIIPKVGVNELHLSDNFKLHLVNLELWFKNHYE